MTLVGFDSQTETGTGVVPASAAAIGRAATLLRNGDLVAFPTETVYGLGADATSGTAVARIYGVKRRPSFNPLIAHVGSLDRAMKEGRFSSEALALADRYWPGPLTLVVPAGPSCSVSLLARAGLDSVALRVPSHPVARALLAEAGMPIAAPSANRSGRISPTEADHVAADLGGRVAMILDGGPSTVGLESTIVACLDQRVVLLRPGGVPRESIEALLGRAVADGLAASAHPLAPGLLPSHYAPRASVRLDVSEVGPREAVLDFRSQLACEPCVAYRDMSPAGDLQEAAANLFAALRGLDASGVGSIAVAPVPHTGLGAAINDRLRRAAAPRPAGP